MNRSTYTGARTSQISFPLGGIGTGSIGLAGNGRLVDWEIFNRPNKGGLNGFSHFAVKAESGGRVLDARVLNGDLPPPYTGADGPPREYLTGLPHFRECEFRGEFPIATLAFKDRSFPGRLRITAFNPFIPLNEDDSGIPAALFEIEVRNTSKRAITYTVAATLRNPVAGDNANEVKRAAKLTALRLSGAGLKEDDLAFGDVTLATDSPDVSHQQYWFKREWFADLDVFWQDFTAPGPLKNRRYSPAEARRGTHATLAARLRLAAGRTARVRFVISWSFPNCENYWDAGAAERASKAGVPPTWRNYYATVFPDSFASARYALEHWDRLHRETMLFKDALFSSSLPPSALDAVSANLSILKSPTVLRLEDGTFYGFEGCHEKAGCCPGTCTHVWNYAQALAFLFPRLERSIRESDYRHNQAPDGGMSFRMLLPLGSGRSPFRPCADGQFGGVLKTYREWKVCGDTEWLRSLWPAVRKSIEFAWAPTNPDRWDPEKTGVLHGRQHHTLDMELFGPNPWLTGFYLAALKAGAEMAEHLGEAETASEFRAIFEKGRRWVEDHLFNGDYYEQQLDLTDRSVVEQFGAADGYWDEEHGQIKHQIGDGCLSDQLLAQWHADLYGLGDVFDRGRVGRTLRAIFRHNFKRSMREHANPCRVYLLNDEAGLLICDWPKGKRKPVVPVPYAQEVFNGVEYAAAAHMIQRGMVTQGTEIIAAVRDRYDGEKRNPWDEFECGHNYARSLASYALLNAFSGFRFDMTRGMIGFDPSGRGVREPGGSFAGFTKPAPNRRSQSQFRCFWSLGSGWGMLEVRRDSVTVRVLGGSLKLRSLELPLLRGRRVRQVRVGRRNLSFEQLRDGVAMNSPAAIRRGTPFVVALHPR
ncbi:MAG: GH116 family glycosyl-hydrolase [Armatimonadota bacterium]